MTASATPARIRPATAGDAARVSAIRAPVTLRRSLGFREAGLPKRVGLEHGRRLDTLLMQRSLAR